MLFFSRLDSLLEILLFWVVSDRLGYYVVCVLFMWVCVVLSWLCVVVRLG